MGRRAVLTFLLKSGKARVIAYPYAGNVPNMDIAAFQVKEELGQEQPGRGAAAALSA